MLTGPYAPRAYALAAKLREKDVVTTPDCDCKFFNDTFCDGARAEYYELFDEMALAYAWHCSVGTRYRGVHLNELHVIHIHSTMIVSDCCECIRRSEEP